MGLPQAGGPTVGAIGCGDRGDVSDGWQRGQAPRAY
jgi:hypothetical protein